MIAKKIYFLAACFCLVALNYSCTEDSTSETDKTYGIGEDEFHDRDTYSIGRDEIDDEKDT